MALNRPRQESIDLLEKALVRSQRKSSVRLPIEFVRDRDSVEAEPPLALLLRGGGEVRIKVLLTVLMQATKPPHAKKVRAKELAAMLALRDPDGAGAKRVLKALRDLERLNGRADNSPVKLVEATREPGRTPSVQVLNPDGSGQEWDDTKLPSPYITLPIDLWKHGWLIALSGRAIALLIILKEITSGRKPAGTGWVDGIRKRQYGLSDDTWTKATRELVDAGLVTVHDHVYAFHGEPRRRNVYTLHLERLASGGPGQQPEDGMSGGD
ncbi:hypothetical protein P0W64_19185 [Tsukamurella sp. 8F]|uniref:hypothetical protein n=1 Tax=unclassified Tsukamurella TaxID=2633480 RepID=UPI0023B9A2B0|nr:MULTISPECIES: hypothetical protein [unclassified Tsukamurella]MDF0531664.1 hypothetical protein [Tsukamurella sp. 8J]MDF0588910.1 hypothetical protein [Tsukamurella sp. 8F]